MDKNGVKDENFVRYMHTHRYTFEMKLLICALTLELYLIMLLEVR